MAKFDESKVITALHPEKAEIGKKYWFADSIVCLKNIVEFELGNAFVLKEIIDGNYPFVEKDIHSIRQFIYPCEEPPKKRMTNKQLAEWCAKENGQCRVGYSEGAIYTFHAYSNDHNRDRDDDIIDDGIFIRSWYSEEWIEPTYDIYLRDCKE